MLIKVVDTSSTEAGKDNTNQATDDATKATILIAVSSELPSPCGGTSPKSVSLPMLSNTVNPTAELEAAGEEMNTDNTGGAEVNGISMPNESGQDRGDAGRSGRGSTGAG